MTFVLSSVSHRVSLCALAWEVRIENRKNLMLHAISAALLKCKTIVSILCCPKMNYPTVTLHRSLLIQPRLQARKNIQITPSTKRTQAGIPSTSASFVEVGVVSMSLLLPAEFVGLVLLALCMLVAVMPLSVFVMFVMLVLLVGRSLLAMLRRLEICRKDGLGALTGSGYTNLRAISAIWA